jgi:hypothetical protein
LVSQQTRLVSQQTRLSKQRCSGCVVRQQTFRRIIHRHRQEPKNRSVVIVQNLSQCGIGIASDSRQEQKNRLTSLCCRDLIMIIGISSDPRHEPKNRIGERLSRPTY